MGIGLRLKEILRNRKMTIKQLAEITGISINTLYSITKRDTINVDTTTLQKISHALGISMSDLLWSGEGSIPDDTAIILAGPNGVSIVDSDRYASISLKRAITYEVDLLTKHLGLANKEDLFEILEYVSKATDILRKRKNAQNLASEKEKAPAGEQEP